MSFETKNLTGVPKLLVNNQSDKTMGGPFYWLDDTLS